MLASWNTGVGASGGAGQGTLASAEGARGRQIRGLPFPLHLPSVSLGFKRPCSKRSVSTACDAFAACCIMMTDSVDGSIYLAYCNMSTAVKGLEDISGVELPHHHFDARAL